MIKTEQRIYAGRALLLLALLFAAPLTLHAQVIQDFSAVGAGQEVFLQWTTGHEAGVAEFRLQRSFDGVHFHNISSAAPLGDHHTYTYTDNDLFKGQQQTYYYRIEIAAQNESVSYSDVHMVSLSFSGVHRTWGSIKAMFR